MDIPINTKQGTSTGPGIDVVDPFLASPFRVIVIGAGAAGLMAARELSAAGIATILLEASDLPGGRIRTLHGNGFSRPVEEGAEFVHGDLPLTLALLKESGIPFTPAGGEMISVRKEERTKKALVNQQWKELMQKMKELKEDLPAEQFLHQYFPGEEYVALRDWVKRYAGGFDLADIRTASTMALYKEWSDEDHHQYRIEGGYGHLIGWLANECRTNGCLIHFSSAVQKIDWEKDRVTVTTAGGTIFTGNKVIISVPAGVLQLSAGSLTSGPATGSAVHPSSAIQFSPAIPEQLQAARNLGYGTIIKILLEFTQPFWKKKHKKLGFILSDEEVPTWWTQYPDDFPLLTGWLPGYDAAAAFKATGEEEMITRCLASLAAIFKIDQQILRDQLLAAKILDWSAEPFVLGGYSFDTVESAAARKLLRKPVEDTLFFAGEALHEGIGPATVEAALASGQETAKKIAAQS